MEDNSLNEANESMAEKKSRKTPIFALIIGTAVLAAVLLVCLVGMGITVIGLTVGNVDTITQAVPDLTNRPVHNQIVFVGNDQNLWLVMPDSTNLRQVTSDGKGYTSPTWSPDGRYLAFVGPNMQGNSVLYISPASNPE